VRIRTERVPASPSSPRADCAWKPRRAWCAVALLAALGCGDPSLRQLENRRELEALLTAISLKNKREFDRDIERISDRRAKGDLSEASYKALEPIITKARSGDWAGAEKDAYALRESTPFFD
jgi:hypothetical protein